MHEKKILVPIGAFATSLKSVHYALALAGRLQAHVFIVEAADQKTKRQQARRLQETLRDLFTSARQAGIALSHYLIDSNFEDEIVDLIRDEHIDLLVFSTEDHLSDRLLRRVRPLVSSQVIQVREKGDLNTN